MNTIQDNTPIRPFEKDGKLYWMIVDGGELHPEVKECLDDLLQYKVWLREFVNTVSNDSMVYAPKAWDTEMKKRAVSELNFVKELYDYISNDYDRYNVLLQEERVVLSWKFYNLVKYSRLDSSFIENLRCFATISTHFKHLIEKDNPQDFTHENYQLLHCLRLIEDLWFVYDERLDEEEESNQKKEQMSEDVEVKLAHTATISGKISDLPPGKYCVHMADGKVELIDFKAFNDSGTGRVLGFDMTGKQFNVDSNEIKELFAVNPVITCVP